MSVVLALKRGVVAIAVAAALVPAAASAQATSTDETGNWKFAAILYMYLPTIGGSLTVPFNSGGASMNVDAQTLLDNLDFAFMGTFDAHNGRFGVFTDLLYMDVSGDKSGTRVFSIGNRVPIPGDVTADLGLKLKGTVWTVAGEYRIANDSAWTVDALAGARLFDMKPTIDYSFTGNIGPLPVPGRSGSMSATMNNWDGIVGLKGQYRFGDRGEWSLPFYVDVGTGESDLTWQIAGGVGYAFSWGDVLAMWRYLDYNFKSGSPIQDINFNGPMLGARFRW